MTSPLVGWTNYAQRGVLSAGSQAANLSINNWQLDHGNAAEAWQTVQGVPGLNYPLNTSWALIDSGADASLWRLFLMARTNLTPTAQVRWRVGAQESFVEAPTQFSVDWTTPAPVVPGGMTLTRASGAYAFNASGVLTLYSSNTFRQQFDPVSLLPLGVLLECASTNGVKNARAEGSTLPGHGTTNGTAPTNWSMSASNGITVQTGSAGTSTAGMPFCDFQFTGTLTASGTFGVIEPALLSEIAAASGQTWTVSAFMGMTGGNAAGITASIQVMEYASGGGTYLGHSPVNVPLFAGQVIAASRITATAALSQSGTTDVLPYIALAGNVGQAVNITLRVSCPQCEQLAFVTSPMLPNAGTPAASTRAADTFAYAFTPYSTGFSLYSDVTVVAQGMCLGLYCNGTSNNSCYNYYDGTFMEMIYNLSGTGGVVANKQIAWQPNGIAVKTSITMDANGGVVDWNGLVTPSAGAVGAQPAYTTINVAGGNGTTLLRKIAGYSSRLSNNQALALSLNGSSLAAAAFDSGLISANVFPGVGQSVVVAPTPTAGRYARVDIVDTANPDGFVNIPLCFAGPVWQPAVGFSESTLFGRDDQIDEVVTRGGQEWPVPRWRRRRWDVDWQAIFTPDLWSQVSPLEDFALSGRNVAFVPDPNSITVMREAVYGRLATLADFGYPGAGPDQVRTWKFRITERL